MASAVKNGGLISMGCNFILMKMFSIGFLHRVRVENRKKNMEEIFKFFHKMAPLAQEVGKNWIFYHNFESNLFFFNVFFAFDLYYYFACVVEKSF
jgi:hypothetical protein